MQNFPACKVCKVGQVVHHTQEVSKPAIENWLAKFFRILRREKVPMLG